MTTRQDNLRIVVDGTELADLHCDLVSLEVELDEQLTGMFRMTLALLLSADGTWNFLDEEGFSIWRKVVITAGLVNDTRRLITGYITHLRPEFGVGLEQCRLVVWGMDASVLMDREDQLTTWPDKKDSDIAAEIFDKYGLAGNVTETEVVHNEKLSTIVQRETDIQLLKRLALRNGFECFVDGDAGYFRPPAVSSAPQPVLAVQFGNETNVNTFKLEVNALTPASVTMVQQDHTTADALQATVATSKHPALGARPAASYLPAEVPAGHIQVGQTVTTGQAEMEVLCRGLFDQGDWFVTGEGEVSGNRYGSILMPRGTVTIKGIGETYSGVYYVTHVTHRFTPDGYKQVFRVKRNALTTTGTEDFAGGSLSADLIGGR